MKLSLILALALLGAVSASQHHEDPLEQEVPAEQNELKCGDAEPLCPTESESFRMTMRGTGGRTYRYVVVNNCQNFRCAQSLCYRCYRGRLASIHNYSINAWLHRAVRSRTNRSDVWLGGKTFYRHRCVRAFWIDRSSWNYSNWARRYPSRHGRKCVTMCTASGLWRNISCGTLLPFVCEY